MLICDQNQIGLQRTKSSWHILKLDTFGQMLSRTLSPLMILLLHLTLSALLWLLFIWLGFALRFFLSNLRKLVALQIIIEQMWLRDTLEKRLICQVRELVPSLSDQRPIHMFLSLRPRSLNSCEILHGLFESSDGTENEWRGWYEEEERAEKEEGTFLHEKWYCARKGIGCNS